MRVIHVRNVHEALPEAMHQLNVNCVVEDTRNGPAWVMPEPVTTVYSHPRERVIFWPQRDANPFFHFYEALWMLGGRRDVASLTRFVKRMSEFSDDGVTFHGAYGYRWRHHFDKDQLAYIMRNLRMKPNCRRQVLGIYDPQVDLRLAEDQDNMRDIPCNLVAHFMNRSGALDMTVFNRSNDIVWGLYGANAVHFSMLHEVVATGAGLPMGSYYHVSDNWHAYKATAEPLLGLSMYATQPPGHGLRTPYEMGEASPFRMVNLPNLDTWFGELNMFLDMGNGALGYTDVFFRRVALPMLEAHTLYKQKEYAKAMTVAQTIQATDWRLAAVQWLQRREEKREAK
jgi:hypothetical protein